MKSTIITAKAFQPVTLAITIESLGEAISLAALFNVPKSNIKQYLLWRNDDPDADFDWLENETKDHPLELLANIIRQERERVKCENCN